MLKYFLPLFAYLFPFICHSLPLDKSVAFKQTACRLGKEKAELLLRFDKPVEGEASTGTTAPLVYLQASRPHNLEAINKEEPGEFSFINFSEKSLCADTPAFNLGHDVLAILYAKNNMPFQDIYRVALWNTKTDKIIHKRSLGTVSKLFPIKGGFAFATLLPRSDADQISMTSDSGRKMQATDKDLNALQIFRLEGETAAIAFDPDLSYKKSEWKKFFKNKEEYLKDAGWDEKRKRFKNVVVYEASHFNRQESDIQETCISLTSERGGNFENPKWHCVQEKQ